MSLILQEHTCIPRLDLETKASGKCVNVNVFRDVCNASCFGKHPMTPL